MTSLYARPLPFDAGDIYVDVLPPIPPSAPVASFTVTPATPSGNEVLVTLRDTSTNSPDLVEFDFTNDGIYDVFLPGGSAYQRVYTPGTYTIKMRVSNEAGTDVATRNLTIAPSLTLGAPYLVGFNSGSTTITTPAGGQFNNGFDDVRVATNDSTVNYQLYRNFTGSQLPDFTGTGILVSGSGAQGAANIFRIPIPRSMTLLSRAGDQILVSCSNTAGANGQTFEMNPIARRYYPATSFEWTLGLTGPETTLEVGLDVAYRVATPPSTIYPFVYDLGTSSSITGTPFTPLVGAVNSNQLSIAQTLPGPISNSGSFSFNVRVTGDPDVMEAAYMDYPVSASVAPSMVVLTNRSIESVQLSSNPALGTTIGIIFQSDGVIQISSESSGTTNLVGEWYSPGSTPDIGSYFQVMAVDRGGSANINSGMLGSWLNLGVDRTWTVTTQPFIGSYSKVIEFSIRRIGGNTLASALYTCTVIKQD